MSQADTIRQYIFERYIKPARAAGKKEITIRAGDIHREMGLVSRMPAVCSALDGRKLSNLAGVVISRRQGPSKGANVFVTYELEPSQQAEVHKTPQAGPRPTLPSRSVDINPRTSLVLVSCVKSKQPQSARAQDLYTSTLFAGTRAIARASGAPWYILSAKYGLVHPDTVIEPYEYTLNRLGTAARKVWAQEVLNDLLPLTDGLKTVVILAGARYREYLILPLVQRGLDVSVPMEGLPFGEQLQWLSEHT